MPPLSPRRSRPLASANINVHLSAEHRLSAETVDNGRLDPDIIAGITKVKNTSGQGVRTGNRVAKEPAIPVFQQPDMATLKGKWNRPLFSVLIGCGLRRNEAAALNFRDIHRCVIPALVGKHNHACTVPVTGGAKVGITARVALVRGRAAVEQIRTTMNGTSIKTTERHFDVCQPLSDAPCDHPGLALEV